MKRQIANDNQHDRQVTPLAGVWIETVITGNTAVISCPSLPLRECGLKLQYIPIRAENFGVTPLAGVWIETPQRKAF